MMEQPSSTKNSKLWKVFWIINAKKKWVQLTYAKIDNVPCVNSDFLQTYFNKTKAGKNDKSFMSKPAIEAMLATRNVSDLEYVISSLEHGSKIKAELEKREKAEEFRIQGFEVFGDNSNKKSIKKLSRKNWKENFQDVKLEIENEINSVGLSNKLNTLLPELLKVINNKLNTTVDTVSDVRPAVSSYLKFKKYI